MFQRNFFGKTIFSGRPENENMVFRAVLKYISSILEVYFKYTLEIYFHRVLTSPER